MNSHSHSSLADLQFVTAAAAELAQTDPALGEVIERVGPFALRLERNRFRMLLRSLVSQQISTAAARSIRKRVEGLVKPHRVTPARFAAITEEQLRACGMTRQKASYLRDAAVRIHSGEIHFRQISRMSDEDAIAELVRFRGVGVWTAQMILIFGFGRPDVFAPADLGLKNAIAHLYGTQHVGTPAAMDAFAERWGPYRSIASWYLWRHTDSVRRSPTDATIYPV